MKGFVKLVKSLFPGEKNGKEIGKMFYIVVKDAEKIKIKMIKDQIQYNLNTYKKLIMYYVIRDFKYFKII